MGRISKAVEELISTNGKAAPDMTHALKVMGDGDMQNGVKRFANYFLEEGKERGFVAGEKSGIMKGAVITVSILSLVHIGKNILDRNATHKKHQIDGKIILEGLKQSVSEKKEDISEKQVEDVKEGRISEKTLEKYLYDDNETKEEYAERIRRE